ncbi:MAG TPA: APC family permease, partial [Clostridia bacterium]|nr:APC family permease [Clostridia bacterium]
ILGVILATAFLSMWISNAATALMMLPIALALLFLVTLLNLRGMRESSKVFGVPTYLFILMMLILIVTGFAKLAFGHLQPINDPSGEVPLFGGLQGISLFLLLRAFSSGCSALTGVEVVSNAVPAFREPSQRKATHVLFTLAGIILFLFGGSTVLTILLKVIPMEGQTVISQLGLAAFGPGAMFYILQFATSLILLIAANTAYNGLPTLLAILAGDGYMPRQFQQRGTRLSFSNGILFISAVSAILLIIFRVDTHHLIPLYAIGAFLSFTLSQCGMVAHWLRVKGKGYRHKLAINGLGALMTAVGTVIVFSTKFSQGSWALAIVIPLIAWGMHSVYRHYQFVGRQLTVNNFMSHYHKSVSKDTNLCIVLVGTINRSVLKALNYANLLTSNVVALNVSPDEESGERLKRKWLETGIDVSLEVLISPYRDLIGPIEDYVARKEQNLEPGNMISVVMARYVEEHMFGNILHNQTAYFIVRRLRKHKNVATVLVPYLYSAKLKPGPKA